MKFGVTILLGGISHGPGGPPEEYEDHAGPGDTLAVADGTADWTPFIRVDDLLAMSDSFHVDNGGMPAFNDTLAVADEGGVLGTFALDEEILLTDARSWAGVGGSDPVTPQHDTLAIADSVTSYVGSVPMADTISLSESVVMMGHGTAGDSMALSDGVSYGAVVAAINDTLAIADAAPTYTASHTGADTLALADSGAAMSAGSFARAETLALADGTPTYGAAVDAINDTLGLTDSGAVVSSGTVTGAETLGLTDSGAVMSSGTVAGAETLALTDSGVVNSSGLVAAADTLAIADTGASITTEHHSAADTLAIADAAPTYTASHTGSDTLAIADAAPAWIGTNAAADTLAIADAAPTYSAIVSPINDSITPTDGTATWIGTNAAADTLAIADTAPTNGSSGTVAAADTLAIADGTATWVGRVAAADTLAIADTAPTNPTSGTFTAADTLAIAHGTPTWEDVGGGAGIAVVQATAQTFYDGVTSVSKTINSVVAGNLLVALLPYADQSNANGKAGYAAPSGWTQAIAPASSTGTVGYKGQAAIYYKENAASGSHTFSLTGMRTDTYAALTIVEVSGCLTSGALDQTASQLSTANTTNSSLTATTGSATTVADEIVFAIGCISGAGVSAHSFPNTGYTGIDREQTDSAHTAYGSGYKIISATGTQSAQATVTGASEGMVVLATFKGA